MTWSIIIPHGATFEVRAGALFVAHHFGRYTYRPRAAVGFRFGEIGSIGRHVAALYD